jgi:hypothetical protein
MPVLSLINNDIFFIVSYKDNLRRSPAALKLSDGPATDASKICFVIFAPSSIFSVHQF